MDRAKTNIETLTRCRAMLKQLEDGVLETVAKTSNVLNERFSGVDQNYQKELIAYIDHLTSFRGALSTFVEENDKALEERIRNIAAYNQTAYRKRNII